MCLLHGGVDIKVSVCLDATPPTLFALRRQVCAQCGATHTSLQVALLVVMLHMESLLFRHGFNSVFTDPDAGFWPAARVPRHQHTNQ